MDMTRFALICTVLLVAGVFALIGFTFWDGHLQRKAGQPPPPAADDEPPTEEFPVVVVDVDDVPWEVRRAVFARKKAWFEAWVAARAERIDTPTAAYKIVVRREFGVALDGVGPREAHIHGRVIDGAPWAAVAS